MSDSTGTPHGFPTPPPNTTPPPPPPPNMTLPPGYVPYGANQGAFSAFGPIRGLARWLGIVMIVLIPVQLIALFRSFADHRRSQDFISGKISEREYTDGIRLQAVIAGAAFVVLIAAAVLTIMWMFRMAKNQQLMNRMGTWKPGWAIAGWFVPPIVLYVVPFLMFRDLWKSSDPDSGQDWRANRVGPIVNVWWVLYGLAPVLFLSATFANFKVDSSALATAKQLDKNFGINAASTVVQIVAAVSFLLLVRQLTARHMQATREA